VVAVGINCVKPQYVVQIIKEIKKETNKPIVVYPNAGETYDQESKSWTVDKNKSGVDASLVKNALSYYKAGARIIGGCCRIRPDTIKKVRQTLDRELGSKQ
jgi:homocysteine S-methyltransferase